MKFVLFNAFIQIIAASRLSTNRGRGRGRGRVTEIEPVILTLSSDDEDTPAKTSVSKNFIKTCNPLIYKLQIQVTNPINNKTMDSSITLATMEKEPVYTSNMPAVTDESIFQWPCKIYFFIILIQIKIFTEILFSNYLLQCFSNFLNM